MSPSAPGLLTERHALPDSRTLRIGVIGLEAYGRVRSADLSLRVPHAEVVALAARSRREARACAATCGIQRTTRDAAGLIDDPGIDALVISCPVESRADLVIRAARAGKPALVAPPIDLDPATVDRAIRAGFEQGSRLQMAFHRRYDPRVLELRRALRDGSIGSLARIRLHRRLPAASGAALGRRAWASTEALVHALDLIRFTSGEEVVELMASRSVVSGERIESRAFATPPADRRTEVVETTLVTASLTGGGLASIEIISGPGHGQAERIELEGSRGSLGRGGPTLISPDPRSEDGVPLPQARFVNREARALLAESIDFVDALRRGRPVAVGPHEARESSILVEAARRAQILGRSVRPDDIASEILR